MTVPGQTSLGFRAAFALILLALAAFLPGLTGLPPVDRDEGRYIVATDRMVETGDYIDIRYQDQPRYHQPAGIYWLQSAAVLATGGPQHDEVWPYRLPSLFAGMIAVLGAGLIGARVFGRNVGIAAGVLLAACLSLNFEARIAKTDAALLASVVVAQLVLMRAYLEPKLPALTAALFWIALGVGLMIKGPVVAMVSFSTILVLVIWDRRARWLLNLRPAWGVLITLAIALPWYVAIGVLTDGDFYARSIGRNFAGKIGSGDQNHGGPPGYHLIAFILFFWPGWWLAARGVPYAWRERRTAAIRFLIAWIVPTWIIFEAIVTKLPHYVLPTYPAIAMLAAAALFTPDPAGTGKTARIVFGVLAVLWLLASGVVAALAPGLVWYLRGEIEPVALLLALAAFAAACAGLWFLWRRRAVPGLAALAASGLIVWANLFGYVAPRVREFWLSPQIVELAEAMRACPTATLATIPYDEPSLVFLYGRTLTQLVGTPEEAADSLAADPACALALVGQKEFDAFNARAHALGLALLPRGQVKGRNYNNNRVLELTLYSVAKR